MNAKLSLVATFLIVICLALLPGCSKIPQITTSPEIDNSFGFDLYQSVKNSKNNVFFSPYSVLSALAMTYEGARGNTALQMQKTLGLSVDIKKVRSNFLSLYTELNKKDKPYQLSTANALWAQNNYPFVKSYINVISRYYHGKANNLNFKANPEKSRLIINKWVEDNTNNKIKDLLARGMITKMTTLVITNAIYFKSNWKDKFDEKQTREEPFELSSLKTIQAPTMHRTADYNYAETVNAQILELDYAGDELSMIIILPKGSISRVERMLNEEKLNLYKSMMKKEKVVLSLPKFKFEATYSLADKLKKMGITDAFDATKSDFTGMSKTGELFISDVIHKAFVEVAEYGTEAAAATAVVIMRTSMPIKPEKTIIFKADHPFIFVIAQKDTGNILFMGRVNDPTKQ